MRNYETVIVFNSGLAEPAVKEQSDKIEKILKEHGAESISTENWGKRELGYDCKKQRYGIYLCFFYSSDNSEIVHELATILRISEPVLLFQTHRLSDRARRYKGRLKKAGEGASDEMFV